jgi:hypothetical protein
MKIRTTLLSAFTLALAFTSTTGTFAQEFKKVQIAVNNPTSGVDLVVKGCTGCPTNLTVTKIWSAPAIRLAEDIPGVDHIAHYRKTSRWCCGGAAMRKGQEGARKSATRSERKSGTGLPMSTKDGRKR